ncbi:unnamed protein product [Linum trigynum]|uniref:Retrotransposon Copia-like N-terminal domain-containing protein n=1 Tax=Linum trigynum TaxID=586398 RepID=A0AAV2F444_9ROSI
MSLDTGALTTGVPSGIDALSPLHLHPADHPNLMFVSEALTDFNYGDWVAEITNSLLAKNKLGFVTGDTPRPEPGPQLDAWIRCNAAVVGWLRTAMSRDVRTSLSSSLSAHQIWEELRERFSTGNLPRRYKLRRDITALRQDHLSVAAFYSKLKRLWDDWLTLDPPARCTCGKCECHVEQRTRSSHEEMRLLDFLIGLDDNFSVVRTQLLSMKPTPTLGAAYQMAANEEQQRSLSHESRPSPVDAAAFKGRETCFQVNLALPKVAPGVLTVKSWGTSKPHAMSSLSIHNDHRLKEAANPVTSLSVATPSLLGLTLRLLLLKVTLAALFLA